MGTVRARCLPPCCRKATEDVFDEWAADQDPSFRHQFYTELLPELRAKGHTLVVISHDDRYFGVADRVVHFRDGRIAAA